MTRKFGALAALALAIALVVPASAAAQVPPYKGVNDTDGSKWFSGVIDSQWGLNCSVAIIGNSYSEIMVQGVVAYGGLQDVPQVGQSYWASIFVSIPGNPCGSGSSVVATEFYLPPGTEFDFSGGKKIECWGRPRNGGLEYLTNSNWNFLGSSGRYCPAGPTIGKRSGFFNLGYRPLANGQMFEIVVPVKSTQKLIGAAAPGNSHVFLAEIDSTGVYANPMAPDVWANVIDPADLQPRITLAQPDTSSRWESPAPAGCTTGNIVNFNAYLYRGDKVGNFWIHLYEKGAPSHFFADYGAINNTGYYWSINNGEGHTLCGFDNNQELEYTWSFRSTDGSQIYTTTARTPFRTHVGPDGDNDGVPDSQDACATTVGNMANGCPESAQADDDKDGVYGTADKCPQTDGKGTFDGCPAGDRDGDGVADESDACPDAFFQTANGCAEGPPADQDGDGIPDASDMCPTQTAATATGCAPQETATDLDADGVPDASDQCPDQPGSTATGCPTAIPLTSLSGSTSLKSTQRLKALAKGLPVPLKCSAASAVTGALMLDKATAKKLRFGKKSLKLAGGKGSCKPGTKSSLKLTVGRAYAKRVRGLRRKMPAVLDLKFTSAGEDPLTKKLKLTFKP